MKRLSGDDMVEQATNSRAEQLVVACEEHNLFLAPYEIEQYAAHVSELSQIYNMRMTVDDVLAHLNEEPDCFDVMVEHFSRKEQSRKVFA